MTMRALRSSSRSRAFSRSSFRTFFASRFPPDGFASRFPPDGFGPRFFANACSDPSRAAFRHACHRLAWYHERQGQHCTSHPSNR